MNKTIEQIRDEAASNFVHYEDVKENPDEFIMRNKNSYSMGFDAGARAGYLKAVEELKSKEARSYEKTRVKMGYQVASSGWGSFLESKIDEVLGG